jgi:hypothetical protein
VVSLESSRDVERRYPIHFRSYRRRRRSRAEEAPKRSPRAAQQVSLPLPHRGPRLRAWSLRAGRGGNLPPVGLPDRPDPAPRLLAAPASTIHCRVRCAPRAMSVASLHAMSVLSLSDPMRVCCAGRACAEGRRKHAPAARRRRRGHRADRFRQRCAGCGGQQGELSGRAPPRMLCAHPRPYLTRGFGCGRGVPRSVHACLCGCLCIGVGVG